MAYTPTVHSEDTDATSTDGIILLNGATLAQAQSYGAVLAVGNGTGEIAMYVGLDGAVVTVAPAASLSALSLTHTPTPGAVPVGTWQYGFTFASSQGAESVRSPLMSVTLAAESTVSGTGPSIPIWADWGAYIYRSGDGGSHWRYVAAAGAAGDASFAFDDTNPGVAGTGPSDVGGYGSAVNAGSFGATQGLVTGKGVSEWNTSLLDAQPAITGALSTVTDAAAKAVLTSILAVLVNKGSASDGTT